MEKLKTVLIICLIVLTIAVTYWGLCFRYEISGAPTGVARLDRLTGKITIFQEGEPYQIRMVRR